jgi:TonB family protein
MSVMRIGVLLRLLLVAGSVAAIEMPLRPIQAPPKRDSDPVRSRMADIETRLGCGVTLSETIYVYGRIPSATESISLVPSILISRRSARILATPRHARRGRTDSVLVTCGSRKATISRKADTGTDDFVADSSFWSVILDAPLDRHVSAELYKDSTVVRSLVTSQDRQSWRAVLYYFTNLSLRTGSLPYAHGQRDDVISEPMVTKPSTIDLPKPHYPEQATAAGIEGRVIVDALVDTAGVVRTALVLRTSGNELLDLAGVRAALDATFIPGRVNKVVERPTPVWAAIPYAFSLD